MTEETVVIFTVRTFPTKWSVASMPAVLECAVIAIPHAHWGERPKAFVTLKDAATATDTEIIASTRDRLAHFKCPDAVEFGPLPKTSTGKVQKYPAPLQHDSRDRLKPLSHPD